MIETELQPFRHTLANLFWADEFTAIRLAKAFQVRERTASVTRR